MPQERTDVGVAGGGTDAEPTHTDRRQFLHCKLDQSLACAAFPERRLHPPLADHRKLLVQVDGQVAFHGGVDEADDLPLLLSHHQRGARVFADLTDPAKKTSLGIGVQLIERAVLLLCRSRCCRSIGKSA
jgi:hypothetical protein